MQIVEGDGGDRFLSRLQDVIFPARTSTRFHHVPIYTDLSLFRCALFIDEKELYLKVGQEGSFIVKFFLETDIGSLLMLYVLLKGKHELWKISFNLSVICFININF